ncbi:MAG: hypothetical protein HND58_02195 [Planctomycetota bacterium]|nr:MAG: hypothetical protein HND58_02195 [Planctomycetota bacterium]
MASSGSRPWAAAIAITATAVRNGSEVVSTSCPSASSSWAYSASTVVGPGSAVSGSASASPSATTASAATAGSASAATDVSSPDASSPPPSRLVSEVSVDASAPSGVVQSVSGSARSVAGVP